VTAGTSEQRENSQIRRQTVAGRPVYVKQYVPGGWRQTDEIVRAQAAREAEIAERLAGLGALTGRLGSVRIVEVDPRQARIVTEEIPGRPLQDAILAASRTTLRRSCTAAMCLAGRWLRVLQSLSRDSQVTVPAPADPEDMVEYCDLRMRTLNELGSSWPSPRIRRHALRWLEDRLAATHDELLNRVWCHGDFGPFNLMWDGYRLTPIDFATSKLDLPLVDVTYLIHRLEMYSVQFPWRWWPISLWRRACLSGYGLPEAMELPIYDVLMVRHLLCRLLTLVRAKPTSWRQQLHGAWVFQRVRSMLGRRLRTRAGVCA